MAKLIDVDKRKRKPKVQSRMDAVVEKLDSISILGLGCRSLNQI